MVRRTPGGPGRPRGRRPGAVLPPPYVGGRGWVGLRLDGKVDWGLVEDLCEDAYRAVAPAKLIAVLDAGPR